MDRVAAALLGIDSVDGSHRHAFLHVRMKHFTTCMKMSSTVAWTSMSAALASMRRRALAEPIGDASDTIVRESEYDIDDPMSMHSQTSLRLMSLRSSRKANYWMPSRTTMTSNGSQIHSKCVPRAGTPNRQINHCQINEFTAVDLSDQNGIVEPSFEVRFHQFDNLLKQLFCEMLFKFMRSVSCL